MSDFLTKGYETPLRIAGKKHDVIGVHIFDQAEYKLPKVGLIKTKDAETGEKIVLDTSSSSVRKNYENWYAQNYKYFKDNFNKLGLDIIDIQVKDDYSLALHKFFKRRVK